MDSAGINKCVWVLHCIIKLFLQDSRGSEWRQTSEKTFTCEFVLGVWMLCPVFMSKMCKCPSFISPSTARTPDYQGNHSMAFKAPNNHTGKSALEKVMQPGKQKLQMSAPIATLLHLWSKDRSNCILQRLLLRDQKHLLSVLKFW